MNTLIKIALVISSVAVTFAANATLKSESQDTLVLKTSEVVVMLGDGLKVNTMALRNDIKFNAPQISQPFIVAKHRSRLAYLGQPPMIRTVHKPQ